MSNERLEKLKLAIRKYIDSFTGEPHKVLKVVLVNLEDNFLIVAKAVLVVSAAKTEDDDFKELYLKLARKIELIQGEIEFSNIRNVLRHLRDKQYAEAEKLLETCKSEKTINEKYAAAISFITEGLKPEAFDLHRALTIIEFGQFLEQDVERLAEIHGEKAREIKEEMEGINIIIRAISSELFKIADANKNPEAAKKDFLKGLERLSEENED